MITQHKTVNKTTKQSFSGNREKLQAGTITNLKVCKKKQEQHLQSIPIYFSILQPDNENNSSFLSRDSH